MTATWDFVVVKYCDTGRDWRIADLVFGKNWESSFVDSGLIAFLISHESLNGKHELDVNECSIINLAVKNLGV